MPKIEVFLDSSALLAGIISDQKAARALLLLGEDGKILLTVSEQVIIDFLAMLNTRHFLDDPEVARRSELRIGAPGNALAWVREQLNRG